MKDRDFLIWIHARLEMYGDLPLLDFMHKLRGIIYSIPKNKVSTPIANNLKELEELLNQPKQLNFNFIEEKENA